MARTVYGIGETICDIIFKDNQPQTAKAGGSTFNAMVTLGRLGVSTSFISKIGDDKLGEIIVDFMKDNNVSTDCLTIWKGHKTDVALAFLDEQGDAEYSFYKEYDKQFVEAKIPDFKEDDILLFGSYFALNPLLRPLLLHVLAAAKAAKVIIYYDPNFRSSHLHEVDELRPVLFQNMSDASIVRGSDEDFKHILGVEALADIESELSSIAPHLIVTQSSQGVAVVDRGRKLHFPAQDIMPLSTIGAGDNFNAGFIYALLKYDISYDELDDITEQQWAQFVELAVSCSSEVCQSYDNYISVGFANQLKESSL